ncbi:MAG: hypothetical protein KA138_07655, partial [Saprospiraceae bacterium]|nr:hypothetical protein [Saprospiraceae bacterium]
MAYSELVLPLVFLICDDQWNIPEPGKSVTQIHSNKENSIDMEDLNVNIKIKLSALWASVTLCYL